MPLPRDSTNPERYLRRDISDASDESIGVMVDVHERMRKAGIAVVRYEVEISDAGKFILPEQVDGLALDSDDIDTPTYRKSLNILAIGWHAFIGCLIEEDYPHALFDTISPHQYMHGTTESYPTPQPILVDVEPHVINLRNPPEHINGVSLTFASEVNGLREWANPYWQANNLPELPIDIPSKSEIFQYHAAKNGWFDGE